MKKRGETHFTCVCINIQHKFQSTVHVLSDYKTLHMMEKTFVHVYIPYSCFKHSLIWLAIKKTHPLFFEVFPVYGSLLIGWKKSFISVQLWGLNFLFTYPIWMFKFLKSLGNNTANFSPSGSTHLAFQKTSIVNYRSVKNCLNSTCYKVFTPLMKALLPQGGWRI